MIVEPSDRMIVRGAVEDLPDLLEEALSIQLGGAHEGVFSQQNVLTSQRCVETTARYSVSTANTREEMASN